MSRVIERYERKIGPPGLSAIVEHDNGKTYFVDTSDTIDHGPETMVFPYNLKGKRVTDWKERYVEWHPAMDEGLLRHEEIINNLEKYL